MSRIPRPGQTRADEDRSPGAGPRLRKVLSRHHAEGETYVHQAFRQSIGRPDTPLHHLTEADPAGVGESVVQRLEGVTVVDVRGMDHVAAGTEGVGERDDAGGQPLSVVEQQHLRHDAPSVLEENERTDSNDRRAAVCRFGRSAGAAGYLAPCRTGFRGGP